MNNDWTAPYRSIDAAGSPATATAVAWAWIDECADTLGKLLGVDELLVETSGQGDCHVVALYHRTKPVAVATIFRDPMNFTLLVRWKAEALPAETGSK